MILVIYAFTLLLATFVTHVRCASTNSHLDQDSTGTPDYDLTEEGKRAWDNLQSSGWGKRSWKDLQGGWGKRGWNDLSGGWGKRGWDNLHGSGWGKRGWQDLQTAGWGKRGWNNLQSSGWGKRSWKNLPSSGWGKRSLNELQNYWGKVAENDNGENVDDTLYVDNLEDSLAETKRSWDSLKGTWGKRNALPSDWASMKGAWGKRDPAWHHLKGLWGKRSDNFSDILSQDTQVCLRRYPCFYIEGHDEGQMQGSMLGHN